MKYIILSLMFLLLFSCSTHDNDNLSITLDSNILENNIDEALNTNDNSETKEYKERELELNLKDIETSIIILDSENTEVNDDGIQLSGQVITIKKSGNYEFSGVLSDGQIIVDTDDEKDVQIILNNVLITNSTSSAIIVENANQTIINLSANSKNRISDAAQYINIDEDAPNSAIFSKDDLVINGEGTLEIIGNYGDAIVSKDKLFIDSGNIKITAKDDGIRGKDYVLINSASLDIEAGFDGIKSTNEEKGTILINGGNIEISCGNDGINAEQYVVVNNGNINITNSYEGIESKGIIINGGDIYLTSSDDGVNVTSGEDIEGSKGEDAEDINLKISGGNLTLNSNGDGLDSNGNIIMTGGNVIVYGPTENNNGFIDYNGNFEISGGKLITVGSSGMAEAPSETSKQNSVLIGLDNAYDPSSVLSIKDESGKEIFNLVSLKTFQAIVISSEDLILNSKYTLEINGNQIEEFTVSSVVTTIGTVGGGGRGGGR